jgi:hypothetical protein
MKLTTIKQILMTSMVTASTLISPQLVQAQLPTIVDGYNLVVPEQPSQVMTTAAAPKITVSCQELKTVVHKGEREAIMVTWSSGYFGQEFTPAKRCQMVSERLQQVANLNGGTFKDLQLASGTVNSQPVICALQSGSQKCDRQNLLFTLKPENARNPAAVIQQIFNFAQAGSSSLNESASRKPQVDMNLGNWEQKAFSQPSQKSSTTNSRNLDTGF